MTQSDLQIVNAKKQYAKSILDIFDAHETLYSKYPVCQLGIDFGSSADMFMAKEKRLLGDAIKKIIEMQNKNAIEASFAFAYLYVHSAELSSELDKLDVIKNPQNYLSDDYQSYADYLDNPKTASRIRAGMNLLP